MEIIGILYFFPFTKPELAAEAGSEIVSKTIGCSGNGRRNLYLVHFPIPSSVPAGDSHLVKGMGPHMKWSIKVLKRLSPVQ